MFVSRWIELKDFDFWCGARAVADLVYEEEFEIIERYMDMISDVWSETEINDFFWFEDDTIADLLGYDNYDAMWEARH